MPESRLLLAYAIKEQKDNLTTV